MSILHILLVCEIGLSAECRFCIFCSCTRLDYRLNVGFAYFARVRDLTIGRMSILHILLVYEIGLSAECRFCIFCSCTRLDYRLNVDFAYFALVRDWTIGYTGIFVFMPPTLKKLEEHIAFGLSVCLSVCLCVC